MPATPISHWIGFHLALLLLLALELIYARRPANQPPLRTAESAHRTAIIATTGWIAAALPDGYHHTAQDTIDKISAHSLQISADLFLETIRLLNQR